LAGNRFRIVIIELSGNLAELGARFQYLRARQLPNYFGAQRFGKNAGNLRLLDVVDNKRKPGRQARSFGLSALRSALFNGYLAERIRQNTWLEPLPGEIAYDSSAKSYGQVDKRAAAPDRYAATGILWGRGDNKATGTALSVEREYFGHFGGVTDLLATYEVRMMRRPLSLRLPDLSWNLSENSVEICFTLSSGTYATAALREFVGFTDSMAG
jgi:tRNA pseudouridine13 synthase